jgi:hypothetical protein
MHLALTATCQKPMHNPAASIGLPVVDLQVNVARSFRTPAESDQSNSLNDGRGRIPFHRCNLHIDKSGIDDYEVNGKSETSPAQDDIIPETIFESYFVRSL